MSVEIVIEKLEDGVSGYYLKHDGMQWVLMNRKKTKEGAKKLYNEKQTYYPSIEQAVVAIMERKVGEATSLQEILNTVKDFKRHVRGLSIK